MRSTRYHADRLFYRPALQRGIARTTRWCSPVDGASAGGDWCDSIELSMDMVALTIGDVSGHGEAVAAKMEAVRATVLQKIRAGSAPSEVLRAANAVACECGEDAIVTAIVALLNRRTGTLELANAGHPPPLLVSRQGCEFLAHSPADLPLGIFPQHAVSEHSFSLPDDALLAFYTDGITECARDPILGEVELARAARLAFSLPDVNPARRIADQIFRYGRGNVDDAAVLAVRRSARKLPLSRRRGLDFPFPTAPIYARAPSPAGFVSEAALQPLP